MGIMGAVAKTLFKPRALSVTDEKSWNSSLWRFFGVANDSGVDVNEFSALNYSAVFCAINLISGTMGTLPLHLLKKNGRSSEVMDSLPLYRVMHDQANEYMTATDLRETMMAHALGWGNGYAEIVHNGVQISELWPIPPNRCEPDMIRGEIVYKVEVDNIVKILPRRKVLHVHGLGFDGFKGYSVIRMAAQSIGLGLAMESFGARFFGSGTHPGTVVEHPGKLSQIAHNNLTSDLMEKHSGLGKTHRLLLLEEGMKIQQLGIPPEDAQFLQSRQFQIQEVARWFNLPPHKLRDLTRSSFNNIESEQISFIVDSILPWCVRSEQSFNAQLLSPQRKKEKFYFKHSVEGHLRGDSKSRGEFYRALWNIGAISQNEVREKEDLPYDENPLADERFVPANMVPLNKIDEYLKNRSNENANNQPERVQADVEGELSGGEQSD